MKTIFSYRIFIIFFFTLGFYPGILSAASVYFDTSEKVFDQGGTFLLDVFVDTKNESINAVEGKIIFPGNILELEGIRDGGSVINFWIKKPVKSSLGGVEFSGITPGGFVGRNKKLFSLVFKVLNSGQASISVLDGVFLKNDGSGSRTSTEVYPFVLDVSDEQSSVTFSKLEDSFPPEDFEPMIGQNVDIFDNKYFIVFSTQDKISGIDKYEVKEGYLGRYLTAESPHLLSNQSLNKKIFVRAVDLRGNTRVAVVVPDNYKRWYEHYFLFGIILIVIVAFGWIKRSWLRSVQ
ncbi:MAG: hypothetical protein AB200_01570 [Parcubacteria bacterium C7867-005]|nr:MAG: hypothetical protein AB200_01570 [Parcubacteria bacterium C7867-005]